MQTLIQCLCEEAVIWRYNAKQSPVASEDMTRLYDPYKLYIQCWALKPHKPSPREGIVKMLSTYAFAFLLELQELNIYIKGTI